MQNCQFFTNNFIYIKKNKDEKNEEYLDYFMYYLKELLTKIQNNLKKSYFNFFSLNDEAFVYDVCPYYKLICQKSIHTSSF